LWLEILLKSSEPFPKVNSVSVPFLNLGAQHEPLRDELDAAIRKVIDANAFAGGPFVQEFEESFADYCGSPHAIGVGSGTDALWLALLALGIGPGDEVVTVPNTFIATTEAISFAGATPVFTDIETTTYNMDPARIEAAITPKTKAIIPVHLFGQMADMDPIMEIARARGLAVVEDASQSHGAAYKGRRAGTIGDAGCFSFYPGKNLGALGEAGAVVTSDEGLRDKIRCLRDHGQTRKYHHSMVGWNGRMDGIQGAALSVKLRHLETWNHLRRARAAEYRDQLRGLEGITLPVEAEGHRHVYHLFVIRLGRRDKLIHFLGERGIACGIHYPVPIHLTGAYQFMGLGSGSFPVAEQCTGEFVSLPMFPDLTSDQVREVTAGMRAFLQC